MIMNAWTTPMPEPPWYKQFWPWALIALPTTAVLAGVATLMIAMHEPDGVVDDDYYKHGLAINRVIERDQRAAAMGLSAAISLNAEQGRSMVVLTAREPLDDETISLKFLHPTRANQDYEVHLRRSVAGVYLGDFKALAAGNWHVQIEDEDGKWRLTGRLQQPQETSVRLQAAAS
jgi:hypothetical protein